MKAEILIYHLIFIFQFKHLKMSQKIYIYYTAKTKEMGLPYFRRYDKTNKNILHLKEISRFYDCSRLHI